MSEPELPNVARSDGRDSAELGRLRLRPAGRAPFIVTGCAGFIGSHLTETLLARGETVVGIDCFTDYYDAAVKVRNVAPSQDDPAFRLVRADLADTELDTLFSDAAGVFHLAAQPGVRSSWGTSFDVYLRRNLLATQRVFEASVASGLRVVYASSSSVYGNANGYPTAETAEPRPVSPYGVTKLACEQLARTYTSEFGLEATGLRYFTVYGPRQRPDMAFSRVIDALARGSRFTLFGTGEQSRDFTFVADAVRATIAAMDADTVSRVYNVGGGTEATLSDTIALVERLSGRQLDLVVQGSAAGDVRRTAADTSLIRDELGWEPEVALPDGLQLQLDSVLDVADVETRLSHG
jgi:UDP-glucuronate 4-epimerase